MMDLGRPMVTLLRRYSHDHERPWTVGRLRQPTCRYPLRANAKRSASPLAPWLRVHHDVHDRRYGAAHTGLDHARPTVRVGERVGARKRQCEKHDDARLGAEEPGSRGSAPVSACTAASIAAGRRRSPRPPLSRRSARGVSGRTEPRSLREDRGLDLLGDVVRPVEREVARKLQMERDLDVSVDIQHGQVVQLANVRHGERCGQDTFAKRGVAALGLDVDDIDPGSASCSACSTRSAAACP